MATESGRERESRFLTAHQHKNRLISAIRDKNRIKWERMATDTAIVTMEGE